MDRRQCFHGFDLNNYQTRYQQINAIAAIEPDPSVLQRQRLLVFKRNASKFEFSTQACMIFPFEQSSSDLAVKFSRRADTLSSSSLRRQFAAMFHSGRYP